MLIIELTNLINTVKSIYSSYGWDDRDWYIFVDGPKSYSDRKEVNKVRTFLKGFKAQSAKFIFRKRIWELANSVISGVSEILKTHNTVIVIEDDLQLSYNFFEFLDQGLDFYEHSEKVISVCGYISNHNIKTESDVLFGVRHNSWGWATWKNRWEKIDWLHKRDSNTTINHNLNLNGFNKGGSDLTRMLKHQLQGKIDSWAIRFCFYQFKNDLISVYPKDSKVINKGLNSKNATHTKKTRRFSTELSNTQDLNFKFEEFKKLNDEHLKIFRKEFSIKSRLLDKLLNLKIN